MIDDDELIARLAGVALLYTPEPMAIQATRNLRKAPIGPWPGLGGARSAGRRGLGWQAAWCSASATPDSGPA